MPHLPRIDYLLRELDDAVCPHCDRSFCEDPIELVAQALEINWEPEFDQEGYAVNWREVEQAHDGVFECESCNRLLALSSEGGHSPYVVACRSLTDLRHLAALGLVHEIVAHGVIEYTMGPIEEIA